MKKLFFALLILIIPLTYGCREKIISYSDSGKTIHLVVDQILKIKLPGDAASSNDWRKLKYDNVILQKKGKSGYMLGNADTPGYYFFRFRAMVPGTCKVYLEYGNKRKSDKAPLKTFEIEVVVHSKSEKI